jgi:hypothetical protein
MRISRCAVFNLGTGKLLARQSKCRRRTLLGHSIGLVGYHIGLDCMLFTAVFTTVT